MRKPLFLLIGLLLFFPETGETQRRSWDPEKLFNAGAVFGFNAAQIDGDRQSGYRQMGLSAGLRATAAMSPTLELSFELLYSQKGAKPAAKETNTNLVDMSFNYAEVPILLNIFTNENWEGFRPLRIQVGFSYSRMLNYEIEEPSASRYPGINAPKERERLTYTELAEFFNNNEISFVAGASYYFNDHFGATLRHTFAFSLLYDSADQPELINESLRNYFLSVQLVYML